MLCGPDSLEVEGAIETRSWTTPLPSALLGGVDVLGAGKPRWISPAPSNCKPR